MTTKTAHYHCAGCGWWAKAEQAGEDWLISTSDTDGRQVACVGTKTRNDYLKIITRPHTDPAGCGNPITRNITPTQ